MAKFLWRDGSVPDGIEIKQVYGLLFSKDGRMLLLLDGDKYSLAGGNPEKFDNNIEGTLRRELLEEIDVVIGKPYIVGYLYVNEENGSPAFAQVRMVALIKKINPITEDPATGKTYKRLLVHPQKAIELLNWGDIGAQQIKAAIIIGAKQLKIYKHSCEQTFI